MDTLIKIVADGLVVPVVLIGAYALLQYVPNSQKYQLYARVLMAGLTAYLTAKIIASIYQPSDMRPFEILGIEPGAAYLDNPGFPSDHVLFTMAITLAVWFATRRRGLALTCLILTLAVGAGRILALVHSPLDVFGGLIIACAGIFWYLGLPLADKNHKRSRSKK